MGNHTTFAVGGPADVFILPHTVKEMSLAIRLAREADVPVTVLGGGSNVLVLDGGIRGIVIQLNEMNKFLSTHENKILASAGFMLKDVCAFAQENALTGMEFACGIPGTLGGAVFMNAGAYGGEMSHIVSRVRTVSRTGSVHTYEEGQFGFGYRQSIFQKLQEYVVEVELALAPGKKKRFKLPWMTSWNGAEANSLWKCTVQAVRSNGRQDILPVPLSIRQGLKDFPAAMHKFP